MTDAWLLRLVSAVEHYEDCHAKVEEPDDWRCFRLVLDGVPAEVRAMARGYDVAQRESARSAENVTP